MVRRILRLAVPGLLVALVLTALLVGVGAATPEAATPEAATTEATSPGSAQPHRVDVTRPVVAHTAPRPALLDVVGASFAAGVGAGSRSRAWPEDLARLLHCRLAVSADPGAGYLAPGRASLGPFYRLASRLDLRQRHPWVLIIQGGHNDMRYPPALVRRRVTALVDTVLDASPSTRVGVLTVFSTTRGPVPAAWAADRAIVAGARAADPRVMVFDPLASHWRFARAGDHLHPSPAGDRWIADRLALAMRRDGVVGPGGPPPAPPPAPPLR